MTAFMVVFMDELLWCESDGFRTVDHSKDPSDPLRVFWLKVILLYWVGDYPGLAKFADMKHAGFYGCHWCKWYFYTHSAGHNISIHNRRNLRANHPFRTDARWPNRETRRPVPLRSHTEVEAQAREIDEMAGPAKDKKQKVTGINGFSLLLLLALFDIVWDMMSDMMHITKGVFNTVNNALFADNALSRPFLVFSLDIMHKYRIILPFSCVFA